MATHSSVLSWEIPEGRGAWWAAIQGVAKSQTRLINITHTHTRSELRELRSHMPHGATRRKKKHKALTEI